MDEPDVFEIRYIQYMHKVIMHESMKYYKREKLVQKQEILKSFEELDELSDNSLSSFSLPYNHEKLEEYFANNNISKVVKDLTELQKKVLYLNILEEYSIKNIAKMLGISASAVEKIKSRAIKTIKRKLGGK